MKRRWELFSGDRALIGHVVKARFDVKFDEKGNQMQGFRPFGKKEWEFKPRKSYIKAHKGALGVITGVDKVHNKWTVRWCWNGDGEAPETTVNAPSQHLVWTRTTYDTTTWKYEDMGTTRSYDGDAESKVILPEEEWAHLNFVRHFPGLYAPFKSAEQRYEDVCKKHQWYDSGNRHQKYAVPGNYRK